MLFILVIVYYQCSTMFPTIHWNTAKSMRIICLKSHVDIVLGCQTSRKKSFVESVQRFSFKARLAEYVFETATNSIVALPVDT